MFIGTSSWKYEGCFGQLYTPGRYEYRGKVAKTRFERGCLAEYAEVFKTVCLDAAYYSFPRREYLEGLGDQVPDDFIFGLKVTDEITTTKFPNLARFGAKAGQPNVNFLNADLFITAFRKPCEYIRPKIGVLMFEFSRFYPRDYEHGRDFITLSLRIVLLSAVTALRSCGRVSGKFCRILASSSATHRITDSFTDSGHSARRISLSL